MRHEYAGRAGQGGASLVELTGMVMLLVLGVWFASVALHDAELLAQITVPAPATSGRNADYGIVGWSVMRGGEASPAAANAALLRLR
ncbi:hypothetical protein [Rugamonas aquatica]|uniref:Uncharacterized protein n=1 Tax=Rugamonas aquatica TaxID=2743357 RepID=A0A6A7N7P8_9BURK|nr:hypothetical protein [Rugamonas aquatica]MQA40767.1 hypothetical protein [Rugamonas aquatica]